MHEGHCQEDTSCETVHEAQSRLAVPEEGGVCRDEANVHEGEDDENKSYFHAEEGVY